VFSVLISYLAVKMAIIQSKQLSPVLHIHLSIVYGFIVAGMVMSFLRIVMQLIKTIKGIDEKATGGGA
jgi:TRAP-type C4-dicarboxylate transport system permease small subunit